MWQNMTTHQEINRQRFDKLKVTHLILHRIHLVYLRLTIFFSIYEGCICHSSSKSPKKYIPPPLPMTYPMIWYILHEKWIFNIDWSHPKIVHMNDIETMKYHVHSILLNFTVYHFLDGVLLDIFSHSLNNSHWIFVIKTTCNHIWICCITLNHSQLYFFSRFNVLFLALHSLLNNFLRYTLSMCPRHTMQQLFFCIFSPA